MNPARIAFSTREVRQLTGLSKPTILNLIHAGRLHPLRLKRKFLFSKQEIEALLRGEEAQ